MTETAPTRVRSGHTQCIGIKNEFLIIIFIASVIFQNLENVLPFLNERT